MAKIGTWAMAVALCVACAKGSAPDTGTGGTTIVTPDAGVTPPPPVDAGPGDAGTPPDAGTADAGPADAGPTFGGPGPWPTKNLQFTGADGIQESPVVGVSTDENQNLWVATHSALYVMRPGTTRFLRFDANTGSPDDPNAKPSAWGVGNRLHLPSNPVHYCDTWPASGCDPADGAAEAPGITEIVGGGPDPASGAVGEVFVGYWGHHDWSAAYDGTDADPWRHSGKLDRVRLNADGTISVVRFDVVSGNTIKFWHNRSVYRMVYDHFIHKHELYVGFDHGVDKISPDLWFPPNNSWPYGDYLYWLSDHLHPMTCLHEWCIDDEGKITEMMGDWRGLAISPQGDLWVGGKFSAGKILYVAANSGVGPNGKPDGGAGTGWFQRGGNAYQHPTFGFQFCGSAGHEFFWSGSGWVDQSCSPGSGTPPVFLPPFPGDPVSITAVTVTPDGKAWFSSGIEAHYGIASWDGMHFAHYDPMHDAGMAEGDVQDMVALPDGRLVLAGANSGLVIWDPATGKSTPLRGRQWLPDDGVTRVQLDMMVNPPALQVATRGGAAVLRVLP